MSKLGHKITFLEILTYVHYSITIKRHLLNKKWYWRTPTIPQYICQVLAKSAFKGPRYEAFKSDTPAKILPYEFIHGQVLYAPRP